MIETVFLEMPLAIALGVAIGLATRSFVGHPARRLLSYAAFVGAMLAPGFWMLPLMMDRAAAFPVYAASRDLSLALVALLVAWSFETWSSVLRAFFGLEQVAMLLRYATWYGLAPQALCTAWDASQQLPTGLGLLLAGLCVSTLYMFRTARTARRVQHA
jgi:hypothetical protein